MLDMSTKEAITVLKLYRRCLRSDFAKCLKFDCSDCRFGNKSGEEVRDAMKVAIDALQAISGKRPRNGPSTS